MRRVSLAHTVADPLSEVAQIYNYYIYRYLSSVPNAEMLPHCRMGSEELESSCSEGDVSDDEGNSASPSSEESDQRDNNIVSEHDTTGAGPSTVVEMQPCVSKHTVETDNVVPVRENDDEVGLHYALVIVAVSGLSVCFIHTYVHTQTHSHWT